MQREHDMRAWVVRYDTSRLLRTFELVESCWLCSSRADSRHGQWNPKPLRRNVTILHVKEPAVDVHVVRQILTWPVLFGSHCKYLCQVSSATP